MKVFYFVLCTVLVGLPEGKIEDQNLILIFTNLVVTRGKHEP